MSDIRVPGLNNLAGVPQQKSHNIGTIFCNVNLLEFVADLNKGIDGGRGIELDGPGNLTVLMGNERGGGLDGINSILTMRGRHRSGSFYHV